MYPPLLPNTKLAKHYIKNVLYVNATCDLCDCLGGITQLFCRDDRFFPGYAQKCQHWGSRVVVRLTGIEKGSKELKSLNEVRSVPLTSYERWG
jgi:hypothetical protein